MLKELVEANFYLTFPKRTGILLNITETFKKGLFSLMDPVACSSCERCILHVSERENVKVSSTKGFCIVNVSQIASFTSESLGLICDYLMTGENSVVFLEMTCSEEKFVERGKRIRAKSQLLNTIIVFSANPAIYSFIRKKEKRLAVFSWKDTSVPKDSEDAVEMSFNVFDDFADDLYSQDNIQVLDSGFLMKEIRYPYILNLD